MKAISLQEAAETYGVSTRTLRRYISAGRLTAYRIGPRLIRLDADQVRCELMAAVGSGNS
ncbi:helix-turn-helix domain-containing protein [Mycolicibacter sinensis]|uniref:helix-turn-helix domain-containing protein n=1 Tax=Mycolicibacter sinensis (strain JDM601) TaxID=875328 RepID=UPI0009EF5C62|nr:helix-turn-helix domain-containing protein [Mycolicibacter sinensis]